MLTTLSAFQSQLAAIMETLAKTAVLEISKLVDIECKILRSEVSRSHHEIDSLRKRLYMMEQMLSANGKNQEAGNSEHMVLKSVQGHNCSVEFCPRTDDQTCIKRENNLEELNRGNSALGEASGFTGQNQPDREKPSGFLQQHCGGKVPIEIMIKQEPNGMDLLDAKSGDPTTREEITVACVIGCSSPEEISSTLLVADNTTDQRTQVVKTTSANLLGKTTLENSAHAQERPFSQAQSSSTIGKTHCAASHSFLSLKPTKTCATSGRSGEKRFACPHCAKRFKCFSQLEIHERSHTGEKPFRCTLCGKMYAQKGHLYTHQRTHTGEKPYRCVHCGKGFIQKCTLDMHQRTHTGEKPFVCAKCGKGFTKKCNLNKHLAVHSDPAAGLRVESSLHDLSLR